MTIKAGKQKAHSRSKFTITQTIRQPGMKLAPVRPNLPVIQGTNTVSKIRFGRAARELLPTLASAWASDRDE